MKWKLALIAGALFCQGCSAVQIRTEFNPVGRRDVSHASNPIVASPDKVAVYIKSSPKGFTLKENELQVEAGYNHKILGEVKAFQKKPAANFKNAKQKTISVLQQAAYDQGANAVIYCVTNISDDPSPGEIQTGWNLGYGSGWAVIVEEKYLQ